MVVPERRRRGDRPNAPALAGHNFVTCGKGLLELGEGKGGLLGFHERLFCIGLPLVLAAGRD